ncbi:unnamed protein product [Rotaria socialis]|uniref:Transposase n=1 Tax=Rotaria socialis TaxID=392032 RepID=A0A820HPD4_9BILA|nr:unnamed protein product [Rotaria socialis]CAF3462722.1 unnamed protein product [Rotaria socialis]CAF4296358.1 unnamed protein product [Rotaria socialis]CAF4370482.1 unnamed protein product [Rotaria socialis]CAF4483284.1 unnamed protein product [Rotaria socialis]
MAKSDSAAVVQRKLRAEFGINTPGLTCIKDTFERFCETGTVEDQERDALKDKPQSSVLFVATDCSITPTTTHRIMTEYLALKPYKAQFVQQLYEEDLQDRVEMCKTLIPMLEDSHMQENLFFSDEATFYVGGLDSKPNIRYWFETSPHVTIETVMNSPKLNVWYDTVNGANYLLILETFFIPEIRKLHKLRSAIFQQDGASPHFSIDARRYLDDHFPGRWIVRGGSIRWALRSPDLTPLDFFLLGHIKNNIYNTPIKDIAEL